ncbi:MAG TPA: NlpC/P60 family protein [Mycobacteriales bacterium]|nr:NlpC/P60 family protein [Mycobacteriales bacterium]
MATRRAAARSVRLVAAVFAVALPLSLVASGVGEASPPLTVAEAQVQLTALQARQDVAVEAFNEGRLQLVAAQRQAAAAQLTVARKAAAVNAVRVQASLFARNAYIGTATDPITGMLAGGDATVLLDRMGNLGAVARLRSARTTALQAGEVQLQALQQVATAKVALAQDRQRQLTAAKSQVDALITAQQQVLNRLQVEARRKLEAQLAAQRAAAQAAAAQAQRDAAAAARAIRIAVAAPPAATRGVARVDAAPAPAQAAAPQQGPAPAPAQQAPPSHAASSNVAGTVLAAAYSQRGKPYSYGAAGPDAYDCSGLVMWAFSQAGISLPHSAGAQYGYGTHIAPADLQPGDIVFFDEGGGIGHDGIYVGNGNMIDANHSGGWVDVRSMAWYPGLVGGTRL